MPIFEDLDARRELLDLTQRQAARLAGMRLNEWLLIESGVLESSLDPLRRMAEVVGLRLALVPVGPTLHLNRSDRLRELVKKMAAPDATGCRVFSRRAIAEPHGRVASAHPRDRDRTPAQRRA